MLEIELHPAQFLAFHTTEVREEQPLNVSLPMLVTELGMVMEAREDMPKHKYEGIVSTSSPKEKEVMLARMS